MLRARDEGRWAEGWSTEARRGHPCHPANQHDNSKCQKETPLGGYLLVISITSIKHIQGKGKVWSWVVVVVVEGGSNGRGGGVGMLEKVSACAFFQDG